MKKGIVETILMAIFCFFISACCVMAPPAISALEDVKLLGQAHYSEAENPAPMKENELLTIEKLQILASEKIATNIIVERGKKMDVNGAKEAGIEETEKLKELGLFPDSEIDFDNRLEVAAFFIKIDDPSKNFIIWFLSFSGENFSGQLVLDDDTGIVLGCHIWSKNNINMDINEQDFLNEWGKYLEINFIETQEYSERIVIEKGLYLTTAVYGQNKTYVRISVRKDVTGYDFGI